MLQEYAKHFYLEDGCNCAEAVLLAANEEYHLGLTPETAKLAGAFGGGMGCASTCGALCGALQAFGVMRMGRRAHETPGFTKECGQLVASFREKLRSDNCGELRKLYQTQQDRCLKTVLLACDVLESHLAETAR